MKFRTPREYENAGIDYMSNPLDEWTEELLTSTGKRLRYNHQKNWYGVADENNILRSFYSPKKGVEYWEGMIDDEGEK